MGLLKLSKFLFVFVFLICVSCDNNKRFDKYKTLENGSWNTDEIIVFDVDIKEVSSLHNLFLNIRTDNKYEYRNLYVITKVILPNKSVLQDTLEYEMADAFGNWLGEGFTDVRNNKLFFLENYTFPEKGNYQFQFSQAMRKRGEVDGISELLGITDVGLRIEESIK